MKLKKRLTFIFAIALVVGIVSCGKDNKKDANDNPNSYSNPYGNQVNPSQSGEYNSFVSSVDNNQFSQYNLNTSQQVQYKVYSFDYNGNEPDCDTWLGIPYCTYSQAYSGFDLDGYEYVYYSAFNQSVTGHAGGANISQIHTYLKALVRNIVDWKQVYNGTHEVLHQDGKIYGINFNYPIYANPVYTINPTTEKMTTL